MSNADAVDCQACGRRLGLPADLKEGAWFACGRCGLILRYGPAVRAFRWASQDDWLRKRGASRRNLLGGALGACAWVVVLLAIVAAGAFPLGLALALALPWLAVVAGLVALRSGRPAAVFLGQVWLGLGGFMLYAWALTWLWPGWAGPYLGQAQTGLAPAYLAVCGGVALGLGGFIWLGYRLRARGLPRGRPLDEANPGV